MSNSEVSHFIIRYSIFGVRYYFSKVNAHTVIRNRSSNIVTNVTYIHDRAHNASVKASLLLSHE